MPKQPKDDGLFAQSGVIEKVIRENVQLVLYEVERDEMDEPCIGTCGLCGAYWDTRYYETCPPPCGGYVG